MTDINILALFGIEITELEIYEQTDSGDGWVAFRIRKSKAFTPCPACGSVECRTNDYRRKPYRFRSQTGIEVRVLFEHRRLWCPACKKAFFEPNPFMRKGAKVLSKEKILEIIGYLKDGIPSTLVAKYSFVSEATVSRVVDRVVKAKRRRLSRVVCIDEFCSFNSAAETKYACMVLDAERRAEPPPRAALGGGTHEVVPVGAQAGDPLRHARPGHVLAHLPVEEVDAADAGGLDRVEVRVKALFGDVAADQVEPGLGMARGRRAGEGGRIGRGGADGGADGNREGEKRFQHTDLTGEMKGFVFGFSS